MYALYEPICELKPVARNIWIVDGPEIGFNYLGITVPFPTRMVLVRFADGGLWIHSPIEPGPRLFARVEALGPVTHLIAPNSIHYWWISEWAERYPAACIHAVPGLAQSAKRPLPPHEILGSDEHSPWTDDLDQLLVRGDVVNEAIFFHHPSRTVILTDLIENFEPGRVHSPWMRWLLRAAGAADPDGKAPIDMRLSYWWHRKPLRATVRRMLEWEPERVIMAHGRWYDGNGAAELRRAFRWVF